MRIDVDIPDGKSGEWIVDTILVSEEEARFDLFNALRNGIAPVKAGNYKRLRRGSVTVMSNTPMEVRTNLPIIMKATGNVLINGLGIGMVLTEILKKERVKSVTVVEKSEDVIKLVGPSFANDERVSIVHADAFEFKPPKGIKYDAVWHDIWDEICPDNLPQMKKLHRKYGKYALWQGSWSRDICEMYEREEKRQNRKWRW